MTTPVTRYRFTLAELAEDIEANTQAMERARWLIGRPWATPSERASYMEQAEALAAQVARERAELAQRTGHRQEAA